ncbi:hypothetical protein WN48_10335 [Eufriesea mexicana]|uniref:Uncharacterized protein n=1 Tax=Eufriesea mexicana TaxID=516756 RepID=A0A310SQY3_9HYME|nr:hypothetical protein WN48_10335 [Eufriesea mexicana]
MKLQLIMQPHLFARLVYRTTPSLQKLPASLARLFTDYLGPSAAKHLCVPSAYLSRPDVRLRRRYRTNLLRLAFSPLCVERTTKFTYLVHTTTLWLLLAVHFFPYSVGTREENASRANGVQRRLRWSGKSIVCPIVLRS